MEDIDFNFDDIDFDIPSTEPNLATLGQSSPPLGPSTSFTETPKEPELQKPKRKKLDHELLLSKEGLPRLMSEVSFLNFGGRGHEEKNLQKLMRYYQLWANALFPKLLFKDFAQKVGTPASHKMVRERIGVWQDEYRDRHMIRAEVQVADKSSSEGEQDEEAYNQILLDSVFPVASNERARSPSPSGAMMEDKEESPVEQAKPNRSDALTILAEQRRKRNLAASKTNETKENTAKKAKIDSNATKKDQQFIEFSDSEDEQPTFTRKRRMIRQDSEEEEEEDPLEKAKTKFKQFTETDIDLSEIPVIEDIQMEDIGDVQLDEE